MAYSTNSSVSGDNPNSYFECAICLGWLDEPLLTACGHRFCKSCLTKWFDENKRVCPLDNVSLQKESDVFPDNFTRREIESRRVPCHNAERGCDFVDSPIVMKKHFDACKYKKPEEVETLYCPFKAMSCTFSCQAADALEEHLQSNISNHVKLLLNTTLKNCEKLSDAPVSATVQKANANRQHLIEDLSRRIVVLEQQTRASDAKLEMITKQLQELRENSQPDPHYSQGTIMWEISSFSTQLAQLRVSEDRKMYSGPTYTSYYGYKFCASLGVKDDMLSLNVHLMQSENDAHLRWPCNFGKTTCIQITLVHPEPVKNHIDSFIVLKTEQAFNRPDLPISHVGVGYKDYAEIAIIDSYGFCANDRFLLKIEILLDYTPRESDHSNKQGSSINKCSFRKLLKRK